MLGKLGRMLLQSFLVYLFQRPRYLLVQPYSSGSNRLLVERLAEEGVREAVAHLRPRPRPLLDYRRLPGFLQTNYDLSPISNEIEPEELNTNIKKDEDY